MVDWDQVRGDSRAYHEMCRLTTLETNEAIVGALAGGTTEIVVNDSHGPMRNLLPELLHPAAELMAADGITTLLVWMLRQNYAARRFYAALGGRFVREQPADVRGYAAHGRWLWLARYIIPATMK